MVLHSWQVFCLPYLYLLAWKSLPQILHLTTFFGMGSSSFSLYLIAFVVSASGLALNAFCRSCFAILILSVPNNPSKMFDGLICTLIFFGNMHTKFCGYCFDLSRSITVNRCWVLVEYFICFFVIFRCSFILLIPRQKVLIFCWSCFVA